MKLRRISTKLVLAVLAAVVLPFSGFAVYVDRTVAARSLEVVRKALLGLAADLALEIDRELEDPRREIALWTEDPRALEAVEEGRAEREGRAALGVSRAEESRAFDRYVANSRVFDVLLLVDGGGRLAAASSRGPGGEPVPGALVERLRGWDYAGEEWFRRAMAEGEALVDHHRSPLLDRPTPRDPSQRATAYHVGIARAIRDASGAPAGVLYGLVSWSTFDDLLRAPLVKDYFRGMVPDYAVPSPYAWIWGADADTILAHPNPELIGERVSGPVVGLPEMVEDARGAPPGRPGLFREYVFQGVRKTAAFQQCDGAGFGWFVGVGINNEDIFAVTEELRDLLYGGTAVVLLGVVLWVLVIARRTTTPILELQRHTARVAEGDLSARIEIASEDELGELAAAFNRMTHDLAENREALIKAEKDAAWREMARQIAHDIKNPLTPIKLSLDLLQRARAEGRPDLDRILERTLGLMERQVANLREIATDFYEFTGGRKPVPQALELGALVGEVVQLHAAWAEERRIDVARSGPALSVWADPGKLRRVLTNLVSNAIQAMPEGGRLEISVSPAPLGPRRIAGVRIEIADTGAGLSEEARARLFEPFFTTKSEGTGLGLAISKRVIEEMGGRIEVEPRRGTAGTLAAVELPAPPAGAGGAAAGSGERA